MSKDTNIIPSTTEPNYDNKCEVCGQSPTVRVIETESKDVTEIGLCGVCCFGEAECIDPDNW